MKEILNKIKICACVFLGAEVLYEIHKTDHQGVYHLYSDGYSSCQSAQRDLEKQNKKDLYKTNYRIIQKIIFTKYD